MDTPQKLGIRVFYYYLWKRLSVGVLLFIASVILVFLKSAIVSKIVFVMPENAAVTVVSYSILLLFAVSILFIAGGFLISWLYYISCTFTVGDVSFNIKRGILNKREISISYRQIQDINIEQTFYHRMMGVSKLIILTAGNDENDKEGESQGFFEVIDANLAEQIRNNILKKTNVQMVQEVKS